MCLCNSCVKLCIEHLTYNWKDVHDAPAASKEKVHMSKDISEKVKAINFKWSFFFTTGQVENYVVKKRWEPCCIEYEATCIISIEMRTYFWN